MANIVTVINIFQGDRNAKQDVAQHNKSHYLSTVGSHSLANMLTHHKPDVRGSWQILQNKYHSQRTKDSHLGRSVQPWSSNDVIGRGATAIFSKDDVHKAILDSILFVPVDLNTDD